MRTDQDEDGVFEGCYLPVWNCETLSADETCETCMPGYTENNGACDATVENCATYSGDNVCTNCENGYYLESATSCVDGILNC